LQLWNNQFSGFNWFSAPVVAADGTLFAAALSGLPPQQYGLARGGAQHLVAMAPDGVIKWQLQVSAQPSFSAPTMAADGNIYLTSADGVLTAFQTDGSVAWSYPLAHNRSQSFECIIPSVGTDGTVYVAAAAEGWPTGDVVAISALGSLKWVYTVEGSPQLTSVGPNGVVYVTVANTSLLALRPEGTVLWEVPLTATWDAASIAADGTIYCSTSDGLVAVNADGTTKWAMQWIWGAVVGKALATDGSIIISAESIALASLHPNGTFQWQKRGDMDYLDDRDMHSWYPSAGPPLIGPDGTVFALLGSYLESYSATALRRSSSSQPSPSMHTTSGVPHPWHSLPASLVVLAAALPLWQHSRKK
jgi:hypothetical protein